MKQMFLLMGLIFCSAQGANAEPPNCPDLIEIIFFQGGGCPSGGASCSCTEYVDGVTYDYPAGAVCEFRVQITAELMLRDTFQFDSNRRLVAEQFHILGTRWATNMESYVSIEMPIANQWHFSVDPAGEYSFIRTGLSWIALQAGEGIVYSGIGYWDVFGFSDEVIQAELRGRWDGENPQPFFNPEEFCGLLTPP